MEKYAAYCYCVGYSQYFEDVYTVIPSNINYCTFEVALVGRYNTLFHIISQCCVLISIYYQSL